MTGMTFLAFDLVGETSRITQAVRGGRTGRDVRFVEDRPVCIVSNVRPQSCRLAPRGDKWGFRRCVFYERKEEEKMKGRTITLVLAMLFASGAVWAQQQNPQDRKSVV